jgi:hypothetical protein
MMMTLPIHLWYLIMHSYASIDLIVNDALTSQIGKCIRWITPELNLSCDNLIVGRSRRQTRTADPPWVNARCGRSAQVEKMRVIGLDPALIVVPRGR